MFAGKEKEFEGGREKGNMGERSETFFLKYQFNPVPESIASNNVM